MGKACKDVVTEHGLNIPVKTFTNFAHNTFCNNDIRYSRKLKMLLKTADILIGFGYM